MVAQTWKRLSGTVRKRSIEILGVVVILVLAGYLRLENLSVNPGWYTDEGTNLIVAKNLLHGQMEYLGINQSTLLFARLPLFPFLVGRLFYIFGENLYVLRTFTAGLGVLSVGLLYWIVRRTHAERGAALALLSSLMLAIYPQAIVHSRLGFNYNLLTPLFLLAYLGLWEYLRSSKILWLLMAALAIGIRHNLKSDDLLTCGRIFAGRFLQEPT